jgi:hypothetical protein
MPNVNIDDYPRNAGDLEVRRGVAASHPYHAGEAAPREAFVAGTAGNLDTFRLRSPLAIGWNSYRWLPLFLGLSLISPRVFRNQGFPFRFSSHEAARMFVHVSSGDRCARLRLWVRACEEA